MISTVTFRGAEVKVTHDGKSVSKYEGDEILISIIKSFFDLQIESRRSRKSETKDGLLISESLIILNKGDEGYVDSILLNNLQNKMGMEIE